MGKNTPRRHVDRTELARPHDQVNDVAGSRAARAQSMVEYALVIALVGVAAIAGLIVLGPVLMTEFMKIATFLTPNP